MKLAVYEWSGMFFAFTAVTCLALWLSAFVTDAANMHYSLERWGVGVVDGKLKMYVTRDPAAPKREWSWLGVSRHDLPQYTVRRMSLLYPGGMAAIAAAFCFWQIWPSRRPPAASSPG